MSDYLQKSYDRAIRDLANAEARIAELEAENARLREALNTIAHDAEDYEIVRIAVNTLAGG